ncbi:MAG TPA: decaprenyl-phosphate phosphoribosyltransferase [Vicinamibacterales bacterium]|nr:decaprenyl-phosphate phosphoribosyltransferase [Vicinamibacterales bacterium]
MIARPSPSSAAHQTHAVNSTLESDAARASTFRLLLMSLRPEQWTKNLFVFAGVLFGGHLFDVPAMLRAVAAFTVFCALSGVVYIFNDLADRAADQRHPLKRLRPIASGRLSPLTAATAAIILGAVSLAAAVLLSPMFAVLSATYVGLLALYSVLLKHLVIIDALTIAAGFVLRAAAGAVAVFVPISHWLLVCTTLLALFLVLSKRRHELTLLADGAMTHRPILEEYSPYLLDQMIAVVTASTLVAYSVYSTSAETAERLRTTRLGLTIPFVLYGIFRYLYLVHQKRAGGSPADLLLTDRPLLACVGLWALSVALILYSPLGR